MASVVKKGGLDVKRKNKLGPPYKRKYVVLRRNSTEGGSKLIEIYDSDSSDSDKECVPLNGIWTVQDRESQNKKRFAFELVIGAHVVMAFSCPSLLERNEWTESFRILNSISSSSPVPRIDDMYSVILEHNIFSAEIGFSGPCLLRIQDGSIVLYSEDGLRKLHHWAFDNVENISMAGDQVILDVYRPSNNDLMQFRFNTDFDSSRNILIACSMLLEGKNTKRSSSSSLSLNNIGLTVSSTAEPPTKTQSLSRGFLGSVKQPNKPLNTKDDKGVVRRAKSFTDKSSFAIRRSLSPDVGFKGSVHSVASQESYAINRPLSQTKDGEGSPPPIPPRAPRRPRSIGLDQIDHIEPDYSYIKDDISGNPRKNNTNETDQQLDDLLRDIEEENRNKKRRQTYSHNNHIISPYAETAAMRKTMTLKSQNTSKVTEDLEKRRKEFLDIYGSRQASDYLEPVPSKTVQEKRSSNPSQYKDWCGTNGGVNKRYSSTSEYSSASSSFLQSISSSSSHDYHTIPDKPTPQHGHTSSMDSTHTDSTTIASDRKSNWGRTLSGSDDPPSPPLPPRPSYLTQIPPSSPTKLQSSKKGDISPYAVTRGIVMPTLTDTTHAPPLPPRSPNKHYRDRVSQPLPVSHNNRCHKCNGVKVPRSSTTRQPHRLPPSPPLDKEKQITNGSSEILPLLKPRPKSDTPNSIYGYGSEIDSALALLDDCVRGLNILDVDISNNQADTLQKATIQTDIDKAIKCAKEVRSDLSQVPIKRAATLYYSNTYIPRPPLPPRSQVSLVHGGTQTTPTRQFPMSSSTTLSSGNIQNGGRILNDHRLPLTRYHSSLLPNEMSSNTVRAHDIRYN